VHRQRLLHRQDLRHAFLHALIKKGHAFAFLLVGQLQGGSAQLLLQCGAFGLIIADVFRQRLNRLFLHPRDLGARILRVTDGAQRVDDHVDAALHARVERLQFVAQQIGTLLASGQRCLPLGRRGRRRRGVK
jgi:hypothetical protein